MDSERIARDNAEDMAAAFEDLAQELIDEAIMMDDNVYEPEVINGDLYMIPLPKTSCSLAIYRRELMDNLPQDIIIRGLKRGKRIMRRRIQKERDRKAMEKGGCHGIEI